MQNLKLEFDQFVRSVEISKSDVFTALLGAGASINSGIKSATECIWEWKRHIYLTKTNHRSFKLDARTDQVKAIIQKWLDTEGIYPPLGHPSEYSSYVEKCYPIEADRRKYFQRLCEKKTPSVGYKLLCLLYEAGIVKSVWTTNFDDLIRDAAIETCNTVIDVSLDSVDRVFRPMSNSELLVVKFHGDYKYGPLKNTAPELAKQDLTFRSRLISYLDDKHLIVAGYSGRDSSVMETLKESYSRRGSGRLYWCGYGNDIPDQVKELIEAARMYGREAYYIATDGFDKLMLSLASTCCSYDDTLTAKYTKYLKTDNRQTGRTPFTIPEHNVNSIIKGNLFTIKLPQEAFQFQSSIISGPSPWKAVRELVKSSQVIGVPYKGYIWALGTLTDVNKCFGDVIIGSVTRVPLTDINLWKDKAIYNLMLSALTRSLASKIGLRSNNKNKIWKSQHVTQRMVNNVLYTMHEALRLSLISDGRRFYLSFLPDFQISTETSNVQVTKELKQEIGRNYFGKYRNKQFDDYILEWRKLLLTTNESIVRAEYPAGSGSGFVFEIYRYPLFAKIAKPQSSANIRLSKEFPAALLHFKGVQYSEPELVFGKKHPAMNGTSKDFHPMRGLTLNQPYDYDPTGFLYGSTIGLAVICPEQDSKILSSFLKQQLGKVGSKEVNKDYLIDYPGFHEVFGISLNMPDPGADFWITCPEPENAK